MNTKRVEYDQFDDTSLDDNRRQELGIAWSVTYRPPLILGLTTNIIQRYALRFCPPSRDRLYLCYLPGDRGVQ